MTFAAGVLAHVKWFTDPRLHPTQYDRLLSWPVIAAFALALSATGVAYLVQHRVPEPKALRALERFAESGPLALRIALGVSLLAAAVAGWLFVPSLSVDRDGAGYALLGVEALSGVLLLAGLFTRYAALTLAALGVVAMTPFSFESILEQVHILGIAVSCSWWVPARCRSTRAAAPSARSGTLGRPPPRSASSASQWALASHTEH